MVYYRHEYNFHSATHHTKNLIQAGLHNMLESEARIGFGSSSTSRIPSVAQVLFFYGPGWLLRQVLLMAEEWVLVIFSVPYFLHMENFQESRSFMEKQKVFQGQSPLKIKNKKIFLSLIGYNCMLEHSKTSHQEGSWNCWLIQTYLEPETRSASLGWIRFWGRETIYEQKHSFLLEKVSK